MATGKRATSSFCSSAWALKPSRQRWLTDAASRLKEGCILQSWRHVRACPELSSLWPYDLPTRLEGGYYQNMRFAKQSAANGKARLYGGLSTKFSSALSHLSYSPTKTALDRLGGAGGFRSRVLRIVEIIPRCGIATQIGFATHAIACSEVTKIWHWRASWECCQGWREVLSRQRSLTFPAMTVYDHSGEFTEQPSHPGA